MLDYRKGLTCSTFFVIAKKVEVFTAKTVKARTFEKGKKLWIHQKYLRANIVFV